MFAFYFLVDVFNSQENLIVNSLLITFMVEIETGENNPTHDNCLKASLDWGDI